MAEAAVCGLISSVFEDLTYTSVTEIVLSSFSYKYLNNLAD